jgi:hypothetical protein
LGEAFIADLYADWLTHGIATIKKVRAARPDAYLKVIASIVPKNVNMNVSPFEHMTDAELEASIKRLIADETWPPARRPELRIPRSSSLSPRKVSASSINNVGRATSMVRKVAAAEMFAVDSGRGTSDPMTSSRVVLPHRFSGAVTASRGVHGKASKQ